MGSGRRRWESWARVKRWWRRLADPFPLTGLGLATAAVAALVVRLFGVEQRDLVWLVVGYGMGGLVAISVFTVVVSGTVAKIRSMREPTDPLDAWRCDTGVPTVTGFRYPRLRWLPFASVDWAIESPAPLGLVVTEGPDALRRGKRTEHLTASRRGTADALTRRFVVQDPFGLARVAFRQRRGAALTVMPHAGALRRMPLLTSLRGGDDLAHPSGTPDGDRMDLRRYGPGDPARFIHWNIYARTRKLMVRIPERALERSHRTVAYLVAGPGDEATAGAARVALEAGVLGPEWTFGADTPDGLAGEDAEDVSSALALIVASAGVEEGRGAEELSAFVARQETTGPVSVVVFAPPTASGVPGETWVNRVLAEQARGSKRRPPLRIVLGVDGLDDPPEPSLLRRLLQVERPPGGTPLRELERLVQRLEAAGCRVTVVDRRDGRVLDANVRAAVASAAGRAARDGLTLRGSAS